MNNEEAIRQCEREVEELKIKLKNLKQTFKHGDIVDSEHGRRLILLKGDRLCSYDYNGFQWSWKYAEKEDLYTMWPTMYSVIGNIFKGDDLLWQK